MKKFVSIIVLAAMLVSTVAVLAQSTGLPGSGWWSGEQVQNIGSSTATVQVDAYDTDSLDVFTAQTTIAAGAAFTFVPSSFSGMPAGFEGSAVVSADQPIKAIVNVTNRQSGDLGVAGGEAAAQYQGIDSTMVDTTLYFPLAKGDHFGKTTTFYVQNAGTSAATATATFTMRNGDVHTYVTPSIGPNQMVSFSLYDTATFAPAVNDAKIGGLVVTSTAPLAGVVMEHFTVENPATVAQSTRGFTAADFDDTAYAPVIKNNRFNRFTGIQVQNVSGGAIDITVTYKGAAGACSGNTYTDSATNVLAGASKTFVQLTTQGSTLPADCTASGTIVAVQTGTSTPANILAVVNESFVTVPASGQKSVTSSAVPAGAATTTVSIPLFKDDRLGKRTGLQIQNVGGSTASNIVSTFVCTGAASFTAISVPRSAVSGASIQFLTPSDDGALFTVGNPFSSSNVNCSVTITSDQPIVAIANESIAPTASFDQDNNNYEGFNLP